MIKAEHKEVVEKFGDDRKTQIVAKTDEINIEDLIKQEDQIVTITHKGYVKRMAIDTYKTQNAELNHFKLSNDLTRDPQSLTPARIFIGILVVVVLFIGEAELNKKLITASENTGKVQIFFEHELTNADLNNNSLIFNKI